MRLDREGYLLVADAYLGIFRVNVATGGWHTKPDGSASLSLSCNAAWGGVGG